MNSWGGKMADTDFFDDTHEKNPLKPGEIPDPLTRDELLCISSQVIRTLYKCVSVARFKQKSDDSKLSFVRALMSSIKNYNAILERDEIETLKRQIDAIERLKDFEIQKLKREIEMMKKARADVKS